MKLIYAGQGGSVKPYTALLFNCTRNQKCQSPFYVPVNMFSDIVFFADLLGEPSMMQIEVMNVCDITHVGTAVSTRYVIGQTNTGSWYATIGNLVVTPPVGVTYSKFFFKLSFTIAGILHVFYSQQYEFPYCDDLKFLRGCYPNETAGTDAYDCNGVYYGFPTTDTIIGDQYYRYIHSAFLRMSSVIEQRNKFTFTAFNSKKIYKSVVDRESLLEFEIVPTFFKDELLGIFARGQVQYDGIEYILADSQDISIIDVDSKLWKMDMLFASQCKQTFGCDAADCVLPGPPPDCCSPTEVTSSVEVVVVECIPVFVPIEQVLPDGEAGFPYSADISLGGTPPFTIDTFVKPAWMTIALVGSVVHFSGNPNILDIGVRTVGFTAHNCVSSSDVYSDSIEILL